MLRRPSLSVASATRPRSYLASFLLPLAHTNNLNSNRRALFDWPGNGNNCASSTGARFDILWGITMLLLVVVILRQWYLDRRARKAIEEVDHLVKVDLESQKIATSNARG